jgi:hypothetical protein
MRSSVMVRLPAKLREWLIVEAAFNKVSESEVVRLVLRERMARKGHVKVPKD